MSRNYLERAFREEELKAGGQEGRESRMWTSAQLLRCCPGAWESGRGNLGSSGVGQRTVFTATCFLVADNGNLLQT